MKDFFRSRYGNIDKRKGSAMLMKKLQGNNKKFFDSGDYNMQKAKTSLGPNPLAKKQPGYFYICLVENRILMNQKTLKL